MSQLGEAIFAHAAFLNLYRAIKYESSEYGRLDVSNGTNVQKNIPK